MLLTKPNADKEYDTNAARYNYRHLTAMQQQLPVQNSLKESFDSDTGIHEQNRRNMLEKDEATRAPTNDAMPAVHNNSGLSNNTAHRSSCLKSATVSAKLPVSSASDPAEPAPAQPVATAISPLPPHEDSAEETDTSPL